MKRIAILGSTGSIGLSTLSVLESLPGEFSVAGLSTNSNISLLEKQIRHFRPGWVCVAEEKAACKLAKRINTKEVRLYSGKRGLLEALRDKRRIDEVVVAITGSAALEPLLQAVCRTKTIALANKEALVMAGAMIIKRARVCGSRIVPVDSEQSAIWQCLEAEDSSKIKKIYLTASGGPFRNHSRGQLKKMRLQQVLKHPRWKMGKKITVDSATMMNKGLELLEAMALFGISEDKIQVLIHPEAIIHSMVEFVDGVVKAQLSVTDMRIPIQYALSYPDRLNNDLPGIDFLKLGSLNFEKPDFKRFPCLRLAYEVAGEGGTAPAVLNAANEVAVDAFLKSRIGFMSVAGIIENTLSRHRSVTEPDLDQILQADAWARRQAVSFVEKIGKG